MQNAFCCALPLFNAKLLPNQKSLPTHHTMSMVEETLGGLRIIKAFCAEEKMKQPIHRAYRKNVTL